MPRDRGLIESVDLTRLSMSELLALILEVLLDIRDLLLAEEDGPATMAE